MFKVHVAKYVLSPFLRQIIEKWGFHGKVFLEKHSCSVYSLQMCTFICKVLKTDNETVPTTGSVLQQKDKSVFFSVLCFDTLLSP